jgi:ribose-phosphate pyrophosphokinase
MLNCPLAFLHKRRARDVQHKIDVMREVVGEVRGKHCVVIDDMIDTAGTIVQGAEVLVDNGAERVTAVATHGVFSGPAFDRLAGPEIEEIVVTDTIPLGPEAPDKIKVLSVADILARSIRSIFTDGSVSELFAGDNQLF